MNDIDLTKCRVCGDVADARICQACEFTEGINRDEAVDANARKSERAALDREVVALRAVAEALKDVVPPTDDWWCPTCRESLSPSRVTYQECCDTCGTWLGAIAAPEWLKKARALLAALAEAQR